ncbi:MAG: hypothetical protein RIS36_619 [Pseudomonadota bacterium]
MRVLPNKTKSNRSSERVRRGPHARTYLVWQFFLGSLLIDPFVPLLTPLRAPLALATTIATWCAIGTLPFLAQERVHRALSNLRTLHTKNLARGSNVVPFSLGLGAAAIVFCKIFMFANLPPSLLIPLVILVLAASRKYVRQVRTQTESDRALFTSNPWAKVERWEHQVIVFALLPLILARAIGVCGALADLSADAEHLRLLFIGISALFLGMLRPDRSFFVGLCKTCKHPVPIVFQDIGSCLSCDARLRIAYHAWVHRLPIEQFLAPPPPMEEKPIEEKRPKETLKREQRRAPQTSADSQKEKR